MMLLNPYRFAAGGEPLPAIGGAYGGGYYAGNIIYGGKTYAIVIADKASETTGLSWGPAGVAAGLSVNDGYANSESMNSASYPAVQYCRAYAGGGKADWYMPARDELTLLWTNLAPGTTSAVAFKTGGAQAITASAFGVWSSTQDNNFSAFYRRFSDGIPDSADKTQTVRYARPIRRVEI